MNTHINVVYEDARLSNEVYSGNTISYVHTDGELVQRNVTEQDIYLLLQLDHTLEAVRAKACKL